jgi:hypothetical protein
MVAGYQVRIMNELEPTWVDEGDEEIARIREVRHQISEQFGHDPYRLVAYYMELEKQHPEGPVPAPDSEIIQA